MIEIFCIILYMHHIFCLFFIAGFLTNSIEVLVEITSLSLGSQLIKKLYLYNCSCGGKQQRRKTAGHGVHSLLAQQTPSLSSLLFLNIAYCDNQLTEIWVSLCLNLYCTFQHQHTWQDDTACVTQHVTQHDSGLMIFPTGTLLQNSVSQNVQLE